MFVLHFVFMAHLAISAVLSDIPQYTNGHWLLNENPQYDTDGESPLVEENMQPENSSEPTIPTIENQNLQTTLESYLLLGQGSNEEVHDSKVWKIVLVTAILLVSLVGSLGTAYYLCVWRGGRIHYQPQRTYA